MKTYTVTAERGEKYWILTAQDVERSTQARSLREADAMARDLISIMTGEAPDSFAIEIKPVLPEAAVTDLAEARRLRDESERANREAAEKAHQAAATLAKGMSLRDVGYVLGVSHQRAAQLVSDKGKTQGRTLRPREAAASSKHTSAR